MTDENENIITETLDDGTEIIIDLNLCMEKADEITDHIFHLIEDENLEHYDPIATAFNIFINTYHILLYSGWTTDELKKELDEHYANHVKTMN